MEIKYFRLIKTIAEEGSIANSSQKLFLTQSALSHQLRELEESLGFKVFVRTRHKWKLTEEGEALYQLANQVLNTIEQGFHKIKDIRDGSKGVIRVSTECYSFYQGLPAFLQKMEILYPEIKIELKLEATHQPIKKLLNSEIDIALTSSKPNADALNSLEIFEDEVFAVLHQENHLWTKPYLAAEDFNSVHLIIHSYPIETVAVYRHFLKPNQITPFKITAIPFTEVSLEMINANQGILCAPKWALQSFKLSEELDFKKIGRAGLFRQHYLVFRKADQEKKYMQDFILNFQEGFREGK